MAYMIIPNVFKSIGTHWKAFYVNGNNVIYFDGFGVEHIPKAIKKNKSKKCFYRIQACKSIVCGYFCIRFIGFMFRGTSLLD